jgi:hypothetical protein
MGVNMPAYARAGSQRWLQIAVNKRPDLLLDVLRSPLKLGFDGSITWISPRADDSFREYRDGKALAKVGLTALPKTPLRDFWPKRGPVWDALGKASNGQMIFVEAKANIPEAASPGTKAASKSLEAITASLAKARRFYAPRASANWTGTFYQYANRLAHHYLLRHLNGVPSVLVFLYFLNAEDVQGPMTEVEWRGASHLLHAALGLPPDLSDLGVYEVFVDVAPLRNIAA